jgi:hypothetical protein
MTPRLIALCGLGAVAGTFATLSLLAARRNVPLTQVVNSSTHAIDGRRAAEDRSASLLRTGSGMAINTGAALFWGGIGACALSFLRPHDTRGRLLAGASVAALAGLVDYGLVPRRLTPGWERVLPPADVALALAGMGAGIAAGAMLEEQLEARNEDA